jgi:hypothetical protein
MALRTRKAEKHCLVECRCDSIVQLGKNIYVINPDIQTEIFRRRSIRGSNSVRIGSTTPNIVMN